MENVNPIQVTQLEIAKLELARRTVDQFIEHMNPVVDAVSMQVALKTYGTGVDEALKKEIAILEAIIVQMKSALES